MTEIENPMATSSDVNSFADLERWLDEQSVTEVECLVPDLSGVARGKILPRDRFTEERGMRLPEGTIALSVTGEAPTQGPYFDVIRATDPDIHLRPDPSTVRIVPWANDPTGQVIHDCYDAAGRLVPFAPRSVLRRVCRLYEEAGWLPVVAPELEFYLVARNDDPDMPLRAPIGRSGRPGDLAPVVLDRCGQRVRPVVRGCLRVLQGDGAERRHAHPRDRRRADGDQLLPCPSARPRRRGVLLQAHVARSGVAPRHACDVHGQADRGRAGSAMHIHQSITDKASGRNLFSNADGTPSREFAWYIGGLQRYVPAATALFAPYVNSYRRLTRFTAAPINIQWGSDNRTVGIRSPVASAAARRVENRVGGADANPYVAMAATLACGWLGLRQRIEPGPECTGNAYLDDYALPRSLSEALQALRDDTDLREILGLEFVTV
jgi:glutamine synthetase